MTEDFYDRLGITQDATEDEIERAFRELVAQHHPDASDAADAEETFKAINEAYTVLSDVSARREYDRLGHDRFTEQREGTDQSSTRRTWSHPESVATPRTGFGIAEDRGSGWTPFFAGPWTQRITQQQPPRATTRRTSRTGKNLRKQLEIDLDDVYHGTTKHVELERANPCPACDGAGYIPGTDPVQCDKCGGRGHILHIVDTGAVKAKHRDTCQQCGGSGTIPGEPCPACDGDGIITGTVTRPVDVPTGIETGHTLRLAGQGHKGKYGGDRGDAMIDLTIRDHPTFSRDEDDLYTQFNVSFPTAVFGSTVTIPKFNESIPFSLPPGTQSGETFRLETEGMPRYNEQGAGDLYVRVQVITPKYLTANEREALRAFKQKSQ